MKWCPHSTVLQCDVLCTFWILWRRKTFRIFYPQILWPHTLSVLQSHSFIDVSTIQGGPGRGDNRCKYIHFILILNWDNEMRWGLLFFTFYIIVFILLLFSFLGFPPFLFRLDSSNTAVVHTSIYISNFRPSWVQCVCDHLNIKLPKH